MEGLLKLNSANIAGILLDAKANVPDADVNLIAKIQRVATAYPAGGKYTGNTPAMTEDSIRGALVMLRFQNAICDSCLKKGNTPLYLCSACKLTFYCSNDCKTAHTEAHAKRCCKADGPLDDGPQMLVVGKVEKQY